MNSWNPTSEQEINSILGVFELEATNANDIRLLRIWQKIKLATPEKWACSPEGDLGGGFWVVAKYGTHCLYYNDIEEGFNESKYSENGKIDEYYCNQDELKQAIYGIFLAK